MGFKKMGVEGRGSMRACKVLLEFEKGNLMAVVAVDKEGKIAGF